MNWRMSPPEDVRFQTLNVNGRTYSGAPGQIVVVPDFDGQQLQANGWTFVSISGPTSARPSSQDGLYPIYRGGEFFDETIGKLIKSDGTRWFDPATGLTV